MKQLLTMSLSLLTIIPALRGDEPKTPADVVKAVTAAADGFLATLNEAERKAVLFDFEDERQRHTWSNLPSGIYVRKGLKWGDLNQTQREALMKLFAATLSPGGVQQIVDNMDGDEVLRIAAEQRGAGRANGPLFGRDEYFISFLGQPSTSRPWMWQFGGHHLAINATIVGDRITLAPSLTGGQPVDFEFEGRTVRQLATEEDLAFELAGSLTPEQQKQAVLADRYANMIWGPGEEGSEPHEEGIRASELTEQQQKLLLRLIAERINVLNPVHAEMAMKPVVKNLDKTWFAWFGPTAPGSEASFRIQGPTVLMEYSPQQLGGDPNQHTHAMYRDPTNDYGLGFIQSRR